MSLDPLHLTVDQRSAVPLYEQICQQIRLKIEQKKLSPGTLLPTTQQLKTKLQVNGKTAQLAMATLAKEGYVSRQARRGTIVTGVPRRGVVAIYSYIDLVSPDGDHEFYRLITSHLARQLETLGRVHRMYLGSEMPDSNNTAGEDLLRNLSDGVLSGVLLVNTPHQLLDRLVEQGRSMRVPVVALSGHRQVDYSVRVDFAGYVGAAAEHFFRVGCRRVGVIYNSSSPSFRDPQRIPNILSECGLEHNPAWIVGRVETESGGYEAASAMPIGDIDGLIVQDDIMATGVDRRLCELGANVPGDLRVATLWNHGSRMRLKLPFERFEADTADHARLALALMQNAINGQRIAEPHLKIVPSLASPQSQRVAARMQPA